MLDTLRIQNKRRSDLLGAAASGLCLIHCLATPFLFVAQAGLADHHDHHGHHGHGASPSWWGFIDIAFLLLSLAAVYWSVQKSTKQWMKIALSVSWIFLAFIILNEKFAFFHLAEAWIYVPALSLVGLHLYNRKYCSCEEEECYIQAEENSL